MTKAEQEVLVRLVISLNQGSESYPFVRVDEALKQLKQLKEAGCEFEDRV